MRDVWGGLLTRRVFGHACTHTLRALTLCARAHTLRSHFARAQVVWVDLLTRREFGQGFGSHTPMFSGQTKCVRYFMNFARALELHKKVSVRLFVYKGMGDCVMGSGVPPIWLQAKGAMSTHNLPNPCMHMSPQPPGPLLRAWCCRCC